MFRLRVLLIAALTLWADSSTTAVLAFGRPQTERSGTRQATAQIVDGQLQLGMTELMPVPETYLEKYYVEEDGQRVAKEVTKSRIKMVPQTIPAAARLTEIRAYGLDRKKVSSADLTKRLAKPTAVLICPDDHKIDSAYARLAKPNTVVLLVPHRAVPDFSAMPMMAMPASAPPGQPVDQSSFVGGRSPMPAPAPAGPAPPAPSAEKAPSAVTPRSDQLAPAAAAAPARPPVLGPAGTQPTAWFARMVDGKLRLKRTVITSSQTTAYQPTGVRAEQRIAAVSVKRLGRVEIVDEFDAKEVQVTDRDGKVIAFADLATRLAEETPVLASANGEPIATIYLDLVKDDTLLLIVPRTADAAD